MEIVSERSLTVTVGDVSSLKKTVTEDDIRQMAQFSGDFNPIHVDDEYARRTRFGKCIAHSIFCTSMISAIIGNTLPGAGTIITSETVDFLRPVFVNDTVTAQVTVEKLPDENGRGVLSFWCKNQDNKLLVQGYIYAIW